MVNENKDNILNSETWLARLLFPLVKILCSETQRAVTMTQKNKEEM